MNFTVQSINGSKEFESKFGPMVAYKLTVLGEEGMPVEVELNQKQETPEPIEGQNIWGHIETNEYGNKLKKDQKPDNVPPAPRTSTSAPTSQSSESDDRQTSIERQNALTNAVAFCAARARLMIDLGTARTYTTDDVSEKLHIIEEWTAKAQHELSTPQVATVQDTFFKATRGQIINQQATKRPPFDVDPDDVEID